MFALHFDMRAAQSGAAPDELYAAAVDMCAWAEKHGCATVVVGEQHALPDGYLPPLTFAAAIAARTERLEILVAAALPPLREPVGLPEEMNILELLSKGRVTYILEHEEGNRDSSVMFVADDVEQAWDEIGMNLLRDARRDRHAMTIEELRAKSTRYRIVSVAEAASRVARGDVLRLSPLCGGIAPDVAWPYLTRAAKIAAAFSSEDLSTMDGPEPLPWGFCAGAMAP